MPVDVFAAVDAAATVEATATLGITTPHMPPTSRSRSPQRRCRSTPWLPRASTVTLASLLCQCTTSVCSRLNRSSRFSTQELLPPSSGSTRTALTPRLRPYSKATLKANFPCRLPRLPVSPRPCRANCTQILLISASPTALVSTDHPLLVLQDDAVSAGFCGVTCASSAMAVSLPTCSLLCVLNGSELCSGWVLPAFALCTCASLVRPAADHGSRAGFRATAAVLLGFASSVVAHPVLGALFPAFPVHSYCSRASRCLSGNLLL